MHLIDVSDELLATIIDFAIATLKEDPSPEMVTAVAELVKTLTID